jgi:hypothetical protein
MRLQAVEFLLGQPKHEVPGKGTVIAPHRTCHEARISFKGGTVFLSGNSWAKISGLAEKNPLT